MKPGSRFSAAMERTGQWVFSKEIPTDVVVEVGEANFSLHKFMLIAKSGYVRKLLIDAQPASGDVNRIDLSDIPGGPEAFEKAAKFCYGVNFEITVHNVAALRCAAEYLQMTDDYCEGGNLAERAEEFLSCAALSTFSGALAVLKSCCDLLLDDDAAAAAAEKVVQRCVDVLGLKICNEANFPSRAPADWWAGELCALPIAAFQRVVAAMKLRGAKTQTVAAAVVTYAEKSLPDLVRDHSGSSAAAAVGADGGGGVRKAQRVLLESIVGLLPAEKAALPIGFLCCLLRAAIFLNASPASKHDLEKRVAAVLEHVMVGDLLVLSFTYDGERLFDLDSVRRIIAAFVDREKDASATTNAVFGNGNGNASASLALQRVAKTIDAYLSEIATDGDLSISKFTGIANLIPKSARKVEDDLYRAVDIFLKAHPGLDEIEREKVCSVMDPLKLSYEARLHASQNKRLPVQIVLHALYYDQLKLRCGAAGDDDRLDSPNAVVTRHQIQADSSLLKENEALRSELNRMKMFVSDLQRNPNYQHGSSTAAASGKKKHSLFSSMSKTLGKLNPFRHGSKDTSNIEDSDDQATKPRRRRFSIS